jgi:hypothetical protein
MQDLAEYSGHWGGKILVQQENFSVLVEADMARLDMQLQHGQPAHVPVDVTVRVEVSYQGANHSGTFTIRPFFDVFFDVAPSDPATGRDGFLAANVSGMFEFGDLPVGPVTIDPCFIIENTFAIQDDAANDVRTFKSRSFHHALLEATDAAGNLIFDYGAMTDEGMTIVESGAGTSVQIDSFFDVFTRVEMDSATPADGGMAHSFFDISYGVFEPNDQPLLQVDARGRVKAGVHLRPGPGDALVQAQNAQSQSIDVMFNPKEYTLGEKGHWNENEGLLSGTSDVPTDSFFDVFFKVQPQPEPPRPAWGHMRPELVLRVELQFSPPQGGNAPPINLRVIAHEVVHTP